MTVYLIYETPHANDYIEDYNIFRFRGEIFSTKEKAKKFIEKIVDFDKGSVTDQWCTTTYYWDKDDYMREKCVYHDPKIGTTDFAMYYYVEKEFDEI